jgi:hypothetical protein
MLVGSTNSVAAAAADTAAAADAAATAAVLTAAAPADTASSRRSTASARSDAGPAVKLVNGLAPAAVDLKGVPPLAPCRIALNQQVSPSVAAAAREREAAPTMEQKFYRDPTGSYSAAAPFWATVSDARWVAVAPVLENMKMGLQSSFILLCACRCLGGDAAAV